MPKTVSLLSQVQVDRLLADPSADRRAETAALVGDEMTTGNLTAGELRLAIDVLEILARDVESRVRESVAEHVKSCAFLPATLARQLADDIESVAVPIIRHAGVLSDSDLLEIIGTGNEAKQLAVALRDVVAPSVADALIRQSPEKVVSAVLVNPGAGVTEQSLHVAIDRMGDKPEVQAALVTRPTLPLAVMERVMGVVSAELRTRLVARHELPPELAAELVERGRERALSRSVPESAAGDEVERLAASMAARGRLTPPLLLRLLCEGDIAFFEAAMARRAGLPVVSVRILLQDAGPLGLPALLRRAEMPDPLLFAFRTAVEVLRERRVLTDGGWRPGHLAEIIDRLAANYDEIVPDGLEEVIAALSRRVLGRRWQPIRRDSQAPTG